MVPHFVVNKVRYDTNISQISFKTHDHLNQITMRNIMICFFLHYDIEKIGTLWFSLNTRYDTYLHLWVPHTLRLPSCPGRCISRSIEFLFWLIDRLTHRLTNRLTDRLTHWLIDIDQLSIYWSIIDVLITYRLFDWFLITCIDIWYITTISLKSPSLLLTII